VSRARDRLSRDDAGFTLVEVLVAFLLLALVSAAMVPLLVLGSTAATQTRMQTEAKNLAQERLEQMRQLAFHVDRQNGPFVDLLDNYFPHRTLASGLGTGWVSDAAARRPGEPAGSFYRVVLDPVPDNAGFTQVVATQFLRFDRAPVAQAAYATYNSQASGFDSPPSLFVGVTVLTSWTANGQAKNTSTFTQISDPGAPTTLIATQAKVTALRAESTAPDTTTFLTAEAGTVQTDGRLSDGSNAAVTATAGKATRTSDDPWSAVSRTAVAPGGAQFASDEAQPAVGSPAGTCGPAAFGRGTVSKVTSAVVGGVPLAPADAGNGAAVPTNQSRASLLANPGGSCGAFWFANETLVTDPRLQLRLDRPLVAVAGSTAGSAPIVQGAAWVNGTDATATPTFVRAGANASMIESVGLFYTSYAPADQPIVRARLLTGSITCDSRTSPPATASYQMTLEYRAADGSYQPVGPAVTFSWNSTGGPATDPLAGVDLTTKVVHTPAIGSPLTLADYVSSWSSGRSLIEGENGVAGLDAALRITTAPTRLGDPTSSVGVVLGAMSCAADDNR